VEQLTTNNIQLTTNVSPNFSLRHPVIQSPLLPSLPVIQSPRHPVSPVSQSPSHPVIQSPRLPITQSLSHLVIMSPRLQFIKSSSLSVSPVSQSPLHPVTSSSSLQVSPSPSHLVTPVFLSTPKVQNIRSIILQINLFSYHIHTLNILVTYNIIFPINK
jgi:hypothetical protein